MTRHRCRLRRTLLAAALAAAALAGPRTAPAQEPVAEFIVVVNAESAVSEVSLDHLSRIFLRKIEHWQDGRPITVVDQPAHTRVHRAFARAVHRRDAAAVAAYWQHQIFSGRGMPPEERRNDQDVLAFVRARADAIGYVSAGTPLGPGVKALRLRVTTESLVHQR